LFRRALKWLHGDRKQTHISPRGAVAIGSERCEYLHVTRHFGIKHGSCCIKRISADTAQSCDTTFATQSGHTAFAAKPGKHPVCAVCLKRA
jgi:hypothetical protein